MLTRNVTFRDEPASPVAATEESVSRGFHTLATACQGDSDGRAGSTATSSNEPFNFLNTAVAAEEEDSLSACESLVGTSVAGDSVVDSSDAEGKDKTPTAAAARRQKKAAPKQQALGGSTQREHGIKNSEPEVGNIGIYFGNWGKRGVVKEGQQALRRKTMDKQLVKNPGHLVLLLESTPAQEELLKMTAVAGEDDAEGLDARPTHEHWVIRGNEDDAILAAARKDTAAGLECLLYELNEDHQYREKGKDKMARSRSMVVQYKSKQMVGHLGTDINVMVSHGNNHTMRLTWRKVWEDWWDRHARHIRNFNVKFWCGDFNMSLTEVPKQLRSRGINADCCAWYPFKHINPGGSVHSEQRSSTPMGIDSLAIFYIGSQAQIAPSYGLADVLDFTAVAANLPVYEGENVPGKHWSCYRSDATQQKKIDLEQMLVDLLTPTCTKEDLAAIERNSEWHFCPYLRVRQTKMEKSAWLLPSGEIHNGAHFPLCIFTNNSRARSREKEIERGKRKGKGKGKDKGKGEGKGQEPQSRKGKGKGNDTTAVAERPPAHVPLPLPLLLDHDAPEQRWTTTGMVGDYYYNWWSRDDDTSTANWWSWNY